jgi:hypothetical protein
MTTPVAITLFALINAFCGACVSFIRSIHLSRRADFAKKTMRAIQNPGNSKVMLKAYDAFRLLLLWPKHALVISLWGLEILVLLLITSGNFPGKLPVGRDIYTILDILSILFCVIAGAFAFYLFTHRDNSVEKF